MIAKSIATSIAQSIASPITGAAADSYGTDFVMEFNIATPSETLTIPAENRGTFNATIDWGDDSTSEITAYNDADLAHTYTSAGTYVVKISGTFGKLWFNGGGDKDKLLRVLNWGEVGVNANQDGAFKGCSNLTELAADWGGTWEALTRCAEMFRQCPSLAALPDGMILGNATLTANMCNSCTSLTSVPSSMTLASSTNSNLMFLACTLDTAEYSQLLVNIEANNSNASVNFHGGNSKYNAAGGVARAALIADHSWVITDGGAA